MARKPRSQWSPAYRQRIERAERAGKSRQQPGGTVRKSISPARRRRARALKGGQASAIDAFARKQAKRAGADPDEASKRLKAWVAAHGYDQFRDLKERNRDREKIKRQRSRVTVKPGSGGKTGVSHISIGTQSAAMEDDQAFFDLPDMDDDHDDYGWLFYH